MTSPELAVAPLATTATAGASVLAAVTGSQEASLAWLVIAIASFAMTIMGSILVAQRRAMRAMTGNVETMQQILDEEVRRCDRLAVELGTVRHQLAEALELGR